MEEGLDPLAYCDRMEHEFRRTWERLDISFDDFIRTTAAAPRGWRHGIDPRASTPRATSTKGVYEGWYCVSCEEFKQEKDLVNGNCPLHPTLKPQWIREKNYFFRLSKYQQPLLDHFAAHPEFLQPENRRNEILRLHRERPRGHLRQPRRPVVGHSAAVRRRQRRLRLVRRADQLRVGRRSRRRRRRCSSAGGRPTCMSSARTSRGFTR